MIRPIIPLLLMVTGIYIQVVRHEWLNWDDRWLILNNPILRHPSWENLQRILFDFSLQTRMALGAEYLPIRDFSTLLDLTIWGNWAGGFLLTNLLLYLGGIVFFNLFAKKISPNPWVAAFATFLFAFHPTHVESVAWAASRKDVLSFFFFSAALFTFESFREKKALKTALLTLLLYTLSLFSKYHSVVFVGYVLLRYLHQYVTSRKLPTKEEREWLIFPSLFISSVGLFAIFKVGESVQMTGYPISPSSWVSAFTMADVFRRYIQNLLFPFQLSPIYTVSSIDPFSLRALPAWLFGFSTLILFVALIQKRKWDVLFWGAWFILALLPVSQIFSVQNKMTDRYLLYPSMSFAFLAAMAFDELQKNSKKGPALPLASFLAISLSFAGTSFAQIRHWSSSVRLWEHAVNVEPNSTFALYQLSVAYKDLERWSDEQRALERLLKLDPRHELGVNNLAINFYVTHRPIDQVLTVYRALIQINPRNAKAFQNVGSILIDSGHPEEAIEPLEKALQIKPAYCLALNNLGRAYLLMNEKDRAKVVFDQAHDCDPD